ncbi:hypothetical protein [Pseudomonas sp. RT6P73]
MERFLKNKMILGLACLLTACSDIDSLTNQAGIHSVNNTGLFESQPHRISIKQVKRVIPGRNTAGQPTISILVGSKHREIFDIILLRSNIHPGYTVRSLSYNHPEIELMTRWNGNLFTQSPNFPTAVTLTIQSLTPEAAVLSFSGLLVDTTTGNYVRLPPSTVTVTGKDLKQLLATH